MDLNAPTPTAPYTNWATAARSIQSAIDAAAIGDIVLVTNGVYSPISTANKAITIQGVDGADVTVIDGGGSTRCATLGSAITHTNTVLTGFTLRNGSSYDGGGSVYGTLNNCRLTGNTACGFHGGGSCYGTLNSCTLSENTAASSGGGSYFGTLNNCILYRNTAASFAGGSFYGTLNNCTLSGNLAGSVAGGAHSCMLNNCIVWGNLLADGTTDNYWGCIFRYCSTAPQPAGAGNISAEPHFVDAAVGDMRLLVGSPCADQGDNDSVSGTKDILGNPRIQNGIVDMGAHEGAVTGYVIRIRIVGVGDVYPGLAPSVGHGGCVTFTALHGSRAFVQFRTNGVFASAAPTYTWDNIVSDGTLTAVFEQQTWHVDTACPNESGDGLSWATAKRSIQSAVLAASVDDTVWVTNGVYAPISTGNKALSIIGVCGAASTIIDGGGISRCATLGEARVHTNTVMVGFTLRNGQAATGAGAMSGTLNHCVIDSNAAVTGGGAYFCTLGWCTLSHNSATEDGGGAYDTTLNDCDVAGNTAAEDGGGAYDSTINDCTLSRNTAGGSGGGAYAATLNNCTLTGNTSADSGGGACDATLSDCRLSKNTARYGGGSRRGMLNNCILFGNTATARGGGAHDGALSNCSLVGNTAAFVGGAFQCALRNCILWNNQRKTGGIENYYGGLLLFCCATPVPDDQSDIGGDPLFVDADGADLRLRSGSPCIDTGSNDAAVGTVDILGNARIQNGIVDMGACEGTVSGHVVRIQVLGLGAVEPDGAQTVETGGSITFTAREGPRPLRFFLTNGVFASDMPTFTWTNIVADGTLTAVFGDRAWFVDATQPDDSGDGLSWAAAKRTLQTAVNECASGDTIWVTNGVYGSVSTTNKSVTIRSVNGPATTVIDGRGSDRCATLGSTSADTNSVLIGFTLRNGSATSGAGSYAGVLEDCVLSGNVASSSGGGSCYGTLNRCTLSHNMALSGTGGGSYYGFLNNCVVLGNSAYGIAGGSYHGTLDNCTLVGNRAISGDGGGAYSCTMNNCVVWGNQTCSGTSHNYSGGTLRYCCTEPVPSSGSGNLAADPCFVDAAGGNVALREGSPCLDKGENTSAAGTLDILGNPRIQDGVVDMGACEGAVSGHVIAVRTMGAGAVDPAAAQVVGTGSSVTFTALAGPRPFLRFLTNGVMATSSPTLTWTNIVQDGTLTAVFGGLYVDAQRPDDSGDGLTWETAKQSLQAAIDRALAGDAVQVSDGVYGAITTSNKAITIQSVNGTSTTAIDGHGAVRCATLGSSGVHTNTALIGFTLRNGKAYDGGGVLYGRLSNCMLMDNTASSYGGGARMSLLNNCVLTRNSADNGGGTYYGTLNNCTLSGNRAGSYAGGSYYGTLNNCIVWANTKTDGTPDNWYSGTFRYSCTLPVPSGEGNRSGDPRFVDALRGDFRLREGSSCIDVGANAYAVGALDGLGNPRIQGGTVDIGACEGDVIGHVIAVRIVGEGSLDPDWVPGVATGGSVTFAAKPGPRPFVQFLTNGVLASTSPTFTWRNIVADGTLTAVFGGVCVDAARPDDSGDGATWLTAKRTLQAGVDIASPGETILVNDGVYSPISTHNKAIVIRSLNGAASTFIDAGGSKRCATLGAYSSDTNTVLVGFTLRNGDTSSDGGGALSGTLIGCVLTDNNTQGYGGGASGSMLISCVLSANSAQRGGGASYGNLRNCTVTDNRASKGGGVYCSTLSNCIVWGNRQSNGSVNNYDGSPDRDCQFRYCCTTPLPTGSGNISADPCFVDAEADDWRLRSDSACVDEGMNSYALGSSDIQGNARIQDGTVDMGAYEGGLAGHVIIVRTEGAGSIDPGSVQLVPDGGSVSFTAVAGPRAFLHFLTNGVPAGAASSFTWTNIRADGILTAVFAGMKVDALRPGDSADGLSWATAKRTLQAAIDASLEGETIWVTNGVYDAITTRNMRIDIRSVNGSAVTAIDGRGWYCCAMLGRGAGMNRTVLDGFTLRNGCAASGAGAYAGTLRNCLLLGNSATLGSGGGACHGLLTACTLVGNRSRTGGGSYMALLENCVLVGNEADDEGGGACESALRNCTVAGNVAGDGGGLYNCAVDNGVVWGNHDYSGTEDDHVGCAFSYSCTHPLPPGDANIDADPRFVDEEGSDVRLRKGSPCIDNGANWNAAGVSDILGSPRILNGTVDMGAYESAVDGHVVVVRVVGAGEVSPGVAQIVPHGGSATFVAQSGSRPFVKFLTNNVFATTDPTFIWEDVTSDGTLTAVFQNWTWYVDATRTDDSGDGLTWATAKQSIQSAIDLALPGDILLVNDGVYAPFDTGTKALTIQSVGGAAATVVDGSGARACAILGKAWTQNHTTVIGLTLRNGDASYGGGGAMGGELRACTLTGNSSFLGGGAYRSRLGDCTITGNAASSGGGVCECTLNNCTLLRNAAEGGGAADSSTLTDCVLSGNSASMGGGASDSTLHNCELAGNFAGDVAGGAHGSTLIGCILAANVSLGEAGAAWDCTLDRCTITGNSAWYVGGIWRSVLSNCILMYNTATGWAGGQSNSHFSNCTLWGNSAPELGGGSWGDFHNCIVWGNTNAEGMTDNCSLGTFQGSCTTPLPPGEGNIDADPLFADPANSNFHLTAWSPCVDAGLNEASMLETTDLDGNPRIFNGTVDIGACEFTMTTVATGLLAGAFRPAGGMRTEFAARGLMPGVSPYAADTAAAPSIPTNAVDWVLLELARTNDLKTIAARSALLLTDGRTLGTGGGEGVRLECAPGWYYLTIKHRNHLAVMSAQPVAYTNAVVAYDFTTGPDKVEGGTNACVEQAPGIWGMIAGDCDGDGKITPVDRAIVSNQLGRAGYLAGDLNLDGKVNDDDAR